MSVTTVKSFEIWRQDDDSSSFGFDAVVDLEGMVVRLRGGERGEFVVDGIDCKSCVSVGDARERLNGARWEAVEVQLRRMYDANVDLMNRGFEV